MYIDNIYLDNGKKNSNFSDKPRLLHFYKTLQIECRISKPYYIEKTDQTIKLRQFTGGEKLRALAKTELIFREFKKNDQRVNLYIEDIEIVEKIWKLFNELFLGIKDNLYPAANRVELVKKDGFDWLRLFEKKYGAPKITVYMHILGEHIWEMIERHGDLDLFTMQGIQIRLIFYFYLNLFKIKSPFYVPKNTLQGLEKLNDLTTMWYFGSTNRRNEGANSYLHQLIRKRNRVDLIHGLEKMPGDIEENWPLLEKYLLEELENDNMTRNI